MDKVCRVNLAVLAKEKAYHLEERKSKGTWYTWYLNSISSHNTEYGYIRSETSKAFKKAGFVFYDMHSSIAEKDRVRKELRKF